MHSRRRLQQYAIAVSIFSVFYNTAEGVVAIVFGAESDSRALIFYGLQSAVEVISAILVTWRFLGASKPGDESLAHTKSSPQILRIERIATLAIGTLLVVLALTALGTSIASLTSHAHPSTALPSLLIAASATALMLLLYLAKRFLARVLDSSTLHGEALCALSCMQLSLVLLVGALVYKLWGGGWWVDAATAVVIGLLFGWEGVKMIRWARNADFDGGCCSDCHPRENKAAVAAAACTSACADGCTTTPTPTVPVEAETEKLKEPEQTQTQTPCAASTHCCGCSTKEVPSDEPQAGSSPV